MLTWVILIVLFPLFGACVNGLFGSRLRRAAGYVGTLMVGLSWVLSLRVLVAVVGGETLNEDVYVWIAAGTFKAAVGFQVDALSAMMIVTVTTVSFFIQCLFVRLHARGPGIRAVLYLFESVCFFDAGPGAGKQLPVDVCGLGGRGALFLSVDRVLVREESSVGRGEEGVCGEPDRGLRVPDRHLFDGGAPGDGELRGGFRKGGDAFDGCGHGDCAAAVSGGVRGSPRSSRFTCGCRMQWRAPRR